MNTDDIAGEIAAKTRLDVTLVRRVIVAAAADVVSETAAGRVVYWPWLGRFEKRHGAARRVRNPKTGAYVAIPAKSRLQFFAAVKFKLAVAPKRPA